MPATAAVSLFLWALFVGLSSFTLEAFLPSHHHGGSSSPSSSAARRAFFDRSSSALFERKQKKKVRKKPQGFGGALRELQTQTFPYAGEVRPGRQSPQRVVSDASIAKPDYSETGVPVKTKASLLPWIVEVKTADEIDKMRASGRIAREILDLAGRAVAEGVTTDEIDAVVHEETLKVRVALRVAIDWLGKFEKAPFCSSSEVVESPWL